MEIPIKVSKSMNEMGMVERRIARVPKKFREMYDFDIGDFINLKGADGNEVSLVVEPAIQNDADIDEYSVFVTSVIFNLLRIANIQDNTIEMVNNITLGCDPELFLIDSELGSVINAGRFFNKTAQVGHDGVLLELRPDPSTNEHEVTNNISKLLKEARAGIIKSWGDYDASKVLLLAASHYDGLTAGFHLHYGLPAQLLSGNIEAKPFANSLIRILDYYVGIPSMVIEGEDCVRRCAPYITYGKPGQYRLDFRTLEYRVPGGYLLRSPVLTSGLLGLGAVVIEDVVSRIKKFTNDFKNLRVMYSEENIKGLYPTLPMLEDVFKSICNNDTTESFKRIDTIYNDIKKMVGYEKRKSSVDPFFESIINNVKFEGNVENNWRI